jgi:hypothetical protein
MRQCSASWRWPALLSTPARLAAYSGSSLDAASGAGGRWRRPGRPGPRRPRRGDRAPGRRPAPGPRRRRTRHGSGEVALPEPSGRAGSRVRRPGTAKPSVAAPPSVNRRSASVTFPCSASSTANAPSVAKSGRRSAASGAARGFGVAPDRLEDRRPLRSSAAWSAPRRPAASRSARPRRSDGRWLASWPGPASRAVVRRGAPAARPARGAFVVGDAAQHFPAQNEQVDQEGRSATAGRATPPARSCRRGPRRQTVDLGLQVRQGDDPLVVPVGGRRRSAR